MITCTIPYAELYFPVGEWHCIIGNRAIGSTEVIITWEFEQCDELVKLMLLCNAIQRKYPKMLIYLVMPYVPFARQDRINVVGEPLSIAVFANVINSLKFERVTVMDPHSDVVPALINRVHVIHQTDVFGPTLRRIVNDVVGDIVLISPDGGALKKIYKLAQCVKSQGVIECSKRRDVRTGEIDGVTVPEYYAQYAGYHAVIVDDICDGGRTFIELAKALIERGCESKRITLMVTHGFFTKGLQVFDGLIDHIYTRKGQVR